MRRGSVYIIDWLLLTFSFKKGYFYNLTKIYVNLEMLIKTEISYQIPGINVSLVSY